MLGFKMAHEASCSSDNSCGCSPSESLGFREKTDSMKNAMGGNQRGGKPRKENDEATSKVESEDGFGKDAASKNSFQGQKNDDCCHDGSPNQKKEASENNLFRDHWLAIASLSLLLVGLYLDHFTQSVWFTGNLRLIWYFIAYIPVAWPVLKQGFKHLLNGDVFTEFFLMGIATIGAFYIGEYPEGVAVMLFYTVGEAFQHSAVKKARKNIASLLDVRPESAMVVRDGKSLQLHPSEVEIGERIVVRPGERVPLDGTFVSETSGKFDTSALTGESRPRTIRKGDDALAGMINLNQVIELQITRNFENSSISRILHMVEDATLRKAKTELFIRSFARVYTPIVVFLALALVLIPALVVSDYNFNDWLYRGLVFLVISCPCALVISIPLGYFGGIGAASRNGILVKGGNYLDALRSVDTVVFDKTGTLTHGTFDVQRVEYSQGEMLPKDAIMKMILLAEQGSTHPVARALVRYTEGANEEFESYLGTNSKSGSEFDADTESLMANPVDEYAKVSDKDVGGTEVDTSSPNANDFVDNLRVVFQEELAGRGLKSEISSNSDMSSNSKNTLKTEFDLSSEAIKNLDPDNKHEASINLNSETGSTHSSESTLDNRSDARSNQHSASSDYRVLIGNERLMTENNVDIPSSVNGEGSTIIHIAINGIHQATFWIEDEVKSDARAAIQALRGLGVRKTVMLSGDNSAIAKKVGAFLGIDEVYADLLPEDKSRKMEEIARTATRMANATKTTISSKSVNTLPNTSWRQFWTNLGGSKGLTAYVGDGINDAPVLALSDVGIAMGAMGSDVAVETADVVIQTDHVGAVAKAIQIGRSTRNIVWQNIALAMGVKVVVLALGALGMASLWEAVFADVGVALLAILNAIRIQKMKF